jgi:hypothetical protein
MCVIAFLATHYLSSSHHPNRRLWSCRQGLRSSKMVMSILKLFRECLHPHPTGLVSVSLANVPVDENVCCVVEITDALTSALLSWYIKPVLAHALSNVTFCRCCLPIYEKNTMQLPTPKGSRPPTSQSVKEITKAGDLWRHVVLSISYVCALCCFSKKFSSPSLALLYPPSSCTFPSPAASSQFRFLSTQPPPSRHY